MLKELDDALRRQVSSLGGVRRAAKRPKEVRWDSEKFRLTSEHRQIVCSASTQTRSESASGRTGVKSVEATGSLAEVGAKWIVKYGGPFSVKGTVLEVERPSRHRQRFSEMLGLVNCTTTARFVETGNGTRATFAMNYVVDGGPIGRLFDGMLGDEITGRFTKDLAGLKAVVER